MAPTPFPAPELEPSTILPALSGDVTALARLYASYHPLVLRTARHTLERLRLEDTPSELAAEVWLRLLDHGCRALRAFDPARGSFRGFMKMVAWQHALAVARRWRRRTLREAEHLPEEPTEPLTPCATESLHHRLLARRMLAGLPELTAIDLVLIEEVLLWRTPACELAPRLGCSANAVYKRSERLRTRLHAAARSIEAELPLEPSRSARVPLHAAA
jgi:RNA polymerase sigma factor (sigma-70 family)